MKTSVNLLKTLAVAIPAITATGLEAAERFDPASQPLGALAPIELSTTDLSDGADAYRTWFENGAWQGDLVEYTVASDGSLTTSIDLSGSTPVDPGGSNWSAYLQLEAKVAANADFWNAQRKIITWDGTGQVAFRWANLTAAQKSGLDPSAFDAGATSSALLDYVRGDTSNEHPAGSLRGRVGLLGDIIHSNPTYVGPPNDSLTETGYASFAASNASRAPRVYVGSNDGMLHVFDADTGEEVYAYIPSMIIGKLDRLAGRPYNHVYAVDGQITVQDANAGGWKTVLVGGLGAGGQGWYALDVTNPGLTSEASVSGADSKVMWELDASADDDLGYSYGQAVIARLNDGNWYAVMGNGYNSVNGIAKLYIVNLETGAVKRISTASGSAESPNGLSSPTLVDSDRDGKADIAYAGDIDGNLWKFDLTAGSSSSWDVAYSGKPLHDGEPTQPILHAPDVTLHPLRGYLVFFATGRLFTTADITDTTTQAMYGIWDLRGSAPPTAATQNLQTQTLSGDLTYTALGISETVQTISPDAGSIDWTVKDGWKVEMPAGFRALTPVTLRGGRVKATLHNPDTEENYVIEPYFADGGGPASPIFDLNQSDSLNALDNVDGNSDGDLLDSEDVVVMWKQPDGLMSRTTVGRVANGVDAQLINYLVPPLTEGCTGDCVAGFQAGHIDVDTDYYNDGDGTGGSTHQHSHEYDKSVGRVYVDYRDHDGETGHVQIDDPAWLPQDEEWIVVVANGDLSPGSNITIDGRSWNVVEYQKMIQQKLMDWRGGTNPLVDDSGATLIFSSNDLVSSGGTVKHDFNDMAIVRGGVHPTQTGCVKSDDAVTKGRYRNGSLVTQFINRKVFKNCVGTGCSLDNVIVQNPEDLPEEIILSDSTRIVLKEDLDEDGIVEPEAYEVFGGVRGVNGGEGNTDLLFESTIFWHYGGSCYGEANWETDVIEERAKYIITEAEWAEILAKEGIEDLDAEYVRIQHCLDADPFNKDCLSDLEVVEELLVMRRMVEGYEGGDATGLGSDGETPVTMGGEASDLGVTAGPNFQVGRRTWTDIFDG